MSMKQKRVHAVIASVLIHLILVAIIGLFFTEQYWKFTDDSISVEITKYRPKIYTPQRPNEIVLRDTTQHQANPLQTPIPSIVQAPKTFTTIQNTIPKINLDTVNPDVITTASPNKGSAQRPINTVQGSSVVVPTVPSTPDKIKSRSPIVVSPKPNTYTTEGFREFLDTTLPDNNLNDNVTTELRNPIMLPSRQLGAILKGTGKNIRGHIRIIRLKHSLSDWWQDPTALPALMKWMDRHTQIRADMNFAGGALTLTDPKILDAPLIVMTGHDTDITAGRGLARDGPLQKGFTQAERAALRKYIVDEGGMLFFDDCGFHGLFANIVADELQQIFPGYPLDILPHEHELYTIHYNLPKPPQGGDVFWGNENNAQPTQFRYQKGIIIDGRLAVVYNRKDYMCAMETTEIESRTMLRLRRSPDVYRFMTNMLVYAMKYGGNTDRTEYKE